MGAGRRTLWWKLPEDCGVMEPCHDCRIEASEKLEMEPFNRLEALQVFGLLKLDKKIRKRRAASTFEQDEEFNSPAAPARHSNPLRGLITG